MLPANIRPATGDSSWFLQDRLGLFIHWGLYALPARHEWVKHHERTTDEDYQKYFDHFDPDLYDPKAWASGCQGCGHEVLCDHHQAPRGLLPVGYGAD